MDYLLICLFPIGILVGFLGTLVGLGGGFLLVPILLYLYPQFSPELIVFISVFVVFLNASSGTYAYSRMQRIDYQSGLLFAFFTIPTVFLGVFCVHRVEVELFRYFFGVGMIFGAFSLLSRKEVRQDMKRGGEGLLRPWRRHFKDRYGIVYDYSFSIYWGLGGSVLAGFLSGFLGIGGGLVHVPVLHRKLNFPIHIATATSQKKGNSGGPFPPPHILT